MGETGGNKSKLTVEQREEVTRRVLAGEKALALANEFGVSRAYVSLLKNQAVDPGRFIRKKEEKLTRKLTPAQTAELERIITSSTPEDNDLIPARDRWSLDHGFQLAERLFGKRPSVRAMKELMAPHIKRYEDHLDEKPKPPKPHHINQLDPELAKDPDFVKYYLSPICEQIAWREYERALEWWEERQAGKEPREEQEDPPTPQSEAHGVRFGKHAKGKGMRHTPLKRRKKKRR